MKKDVELVIRARDEASRAGELIADVLDRMTKSARAAGAGSKDASGGIELLGAALAKVQGEYRAIDSAANNATAAFERQKRTLSETREQHSALGVQIAAAKSNLERLRATEAADADAKKKQAADIRLVESALKSLIKQQEALGKAAERQEVAVNDAQLALQRIGSQATAAEIGVVEAALRRNTQAAEEYAQAMRVAAGTRFQQNLDDTLGVGRMPSSSARASAAVFEEAAKAKERDAAAAARIRAELNPLAAAQANLNARIAEANRLHEAGELDVKEHAAQLRRLRQEAVEAGKALRGTGGRGDRSNVSLFGLKPYEIQNLSYQINDVITQLGSGTAPTQVLAQQGGQIAQIFAGGRGGSFFASIANGAKAAGPWVALIAVTLGTVVAALKQIADAEKSTRLFTAQTGASADGGLYNPKVLAEAAHEIDVIAGNLKEARAQVSAMMREDVAEGRLTDLAITAKNFAKIYGLDVVDATKEVSKAFTGQFKEIDELDKAYNFLSKAERDRIKLLFEQGKAEEAREVALGAFSAKMNGAAENMKGPWTKSLEALSRAWDNFITWLSELGPLKAAVEWLKSIAEWADKATSAMIRTQNRNEIVRTERKIAELEVELAAAEGKEGKSGMPRGRALLRSNLNTRASGVVAADLAAARADLAKYQGQQTGGVTNQGSQQGAKEDDRREEANADKAKREADKAAREAERARREREAAEEQLASALESLESKALKLSTASLDSRWAAIDKEYEKLSRDIDEALEKGVTEIDGMSVDAYRKRVEAAKVLLKQQAEMTYYSEAMKDLEDQRSARLKIIQDQLADGLISEEAAFAAIKAVADDLAPAMRTIASDALLFARELYAAKPSPELAKFIAQMERAANREAKPGGRGSEAAAEQLRNLSSAEQTMGRIVSARNELISLAQREYELGLLTTEQYNARVQQAYDKTTLAIEGQISTIRNLVELLKEQGTLSVIEYDTWIAKLDGVSLGLENTTAQILSVADANAMLVDAGVSAWNNFFDAIEEGKSVLTAFMDSMRQMLSDIFRDIAQIIVRAMVLRALMKTPLGKIISEATGGLFDAKGAQEAAKELGVAGALWKWVVEGLKQAARDLMAAGAVNTAGGVQGGASSLFSNAASFLAGVRHNGGLAGGGGPTRNVALSAFANAARYHGGGMPGLGLRSNEVATILEKDEEVLKRTDPRHILNGGGRPGSMKVINVLDGPDVLQHALADERGQGVFLNYVRKNSDEFKIALGVAR